MIWPLLLSKNNIHLLMSKVTKGSIPDIRTQLSSALKVTKSATSSAEWNVGRHLLETSQVEVFWAFCYTIKVDRITHNLYKATQNKISCWPIAERDWDIKYVLSWQLIMERTIECDIRCCCCIFKLTTVFNCSKNRCNLLELQKKLLSNIYRWIDQKEDAGFGLIL